MSDKKPSSLIVDLRPQERLVLSDGVTVELLHKSGQLCRLRVVAPKEVRIQKTGNHTGENVASMV
jgi:sRNA-binding carbon storage regulator CsrA